MNNPKKLAAIGIAALALAACSGTSSSVINPVHGPGMGQQSVSHGVTQVAGLDLTKVHIMQTFNNRIGVLPNAPQTLTYRGGKVETKPAVYIAYWGFNKSGSDPSKEKAYLNKFVQGIGGSKWMSLDTQYYQKVGSKTTHISNPTGMLAGSWVDSSAVPSAPSDAQVQAEAARLMAHFAYNKNASYVVATPHGHNTPGFGTSYCAYHGAFTSSKGVLSYTNLGYMTDAGANCGAGFVNSPGTLDGISIVEGHEYAESQTDISPPTGWYNNSYGEIGDICAWMKPPAGDITLSTGKFAVQGLWSNKTSQCSITGP